MSPVGRTANTSRTFCRFVDISGVRGGRDADQDDSDADQDDSDAQDDSEQTKPTGTAVQIITNDVKFTVSCPEANESVGKFGGGGGGTAAQGFDGRRAATARTVAAAPNGASHRADAKGHRSGQETGSASSLQAIAIARDAGGGGASGYWTPASRSALPTRPRRPFSSAGTRPREPSRRFAHSEHAESAADEMLERWKALRAVVVTCDVAHIYCEREQCAVVRGLPAACPSRPRPEAAAGVRTVPLAACRPAQQTLLSG